MMSSILRKVKLREDTTTFTMKNGETILKELIAASNGKYNPFRTFSAQELKLATNNYDKQKIIEDGGFYKLYKGFWQERLISVMKFQSNYVHYYAHEDVYGCCINNIVYALQMSHKHILKLNGCCLETEIPILVFESAEYETLEVHIHGSRLPDSEPLLLTNRLKIAMEIAEAVAYLHLGFPRPIVFRNIKLSNILFNEQNIAKLFDFSLCKAIPEGETHIKLHMVSGSTGFIAPEYLIKGEYNEKCDVYSFGVLLLGLLTGRKPVDFARNIDIADCSNVVEYIKKYIESNRLIEIVDPIIAENGLCLEKVKEQQLQAFEELICECMDFSPEDRPMMMDVAKRLRQMYRSCI